MDEGAVQVVLVVHCTALGGASHTDAYMWGVT